MKRYLILLFLPGIFSLTMVWNLFGQKTQDRVYVGEKVCRNCHHLQGNRNQFNPWRLSKHANAYASLFKPEAKPIAELSGIDIKPYKSPICLGCHTTAYIVEDWERDDSFHFEDGVQCELCHGPGSEYIDINIMGNRDLAIQAGLIIPGERNCMVCHKEKNSHVTVLNTKNFDFKEAFQIIKHSGSGGVVSPRNPLVAEPVPGLKYIGAMACATCHGTKSEGRIYNKWHSSAHARAYAILGTRRAEEIAKEMGLSGHLQKSEACLKCHITGRGKTTGQFMDSFDAAQGVQCESCHGPGSEHIIETAKLNPETNNATSGLQKISRDLCTKCHTKDIHGHFFDFETMYPKIAHSKWQEEYHRVEYKTPFNLAITQDGKRLFVACEASNSMIVVNAESEEILTEVPIGVQPHSACLSPDETLIYVSNRASDNVSVIDTKTYRVLSTITVGDEPHEIAVTNDGKVMYVANAGTYDVSVVDLERNKEIKRLAASRGPWGAALSPDGRLVYISNNLPRFGKFRTTPKSEVTVINTQNSTVKYRYTLSDANLIQGIAVSPDNQFVMTTLIRTKNLVPMTRNLQGWIMTNGIGILWQDGSVDQLLLDEVNDFFADPTDVVFSKDGQYAFISGGGVREVAMVDISEMKKILLNASDEERRDILPNHLGLSSQYVLEKIPVGQSPRGMVISPDNKFLYVADGLDDAISVIDINKRQRIKVIDLGGPKKITQARYGERIFHSAEFTFARQFSCHSCHPDGGVDGLTYDIEPDGLGINPVDNRTLRGINDTAPFKWTGKNPTLKRQCGPRLAAFFTRIDPFKPEQSAALDRYIVTIPRPPNRYRTGKELTQAQRRGKLIFQRRYDNSGNPIPQKNQCGFCHSFPYFTSREKFDVGSSSWLDTHGVFDVPHLNNIYATPPYLHDGRASSLDEIWTIYNPKDTHGVTNDLTKDQLNDLIEYLKTL
jgi:YVTN family beta-propeller protein